MEGDKLALLVDRETYDVMYPFSEKFREQARKIFPVILDRMDEGDTIFSIFGAPGKGKTEVAHILRSMLYKGGKSVIIASLDDYYEIGWKDRNKHRIETGVIGSEEIEWSEVDWTIDLHKREDLGVILRMDKYGNGSENKQRIYYDPSDYDVLIFEGLYPVKKADFIIFLSGTYHDTEAFRRARKKENQDDPFRNIVLDAEQRAIDNLKHLADFEV